MKKSMIVGLVAGACLAAVAADEYVTFNGLVFPKDGKTIMTRAGIGDLGHAEYALTYGWNTMADGAYWSDGEEPSYDKAYRIASDRFATFGEKPDTFAGMSLTLGTANSNGWLIPYFKSGEINMITLPETIVNRGGFILRSEPGAEGIIVGGPITVNATSANPFEIWDHYASKKTLRIQADLIGGETACIYINNRDAAYNKSEAVLGLDGYMGEYLGEVKAGRYTRIGYGFVTLPGSVNLAATNTTLTPLANALVNNLSVATLKATAGAVVEVGGASTKPASIHVTDSLQLPETGKVTLAFNQPAWDSYRVSLLGNYWEGHLYNAEESTYDFFSIPDTGTSLFDLFNVTLNIPVDPYGEKFRYVAQIPCLPFETVEDDCRILRIVKPKTTYLTANNNKNAFLPGYGDCWYDRTAADGFDADTVYAIPSEFGAHLPSSSYAFPGKMLMQVWSSWVRQYADATIPEYVLPANSIHYADTNIAVTLGGRLMIPRFPYGQKPAAEDGYYSYYESALWAKAAGLTVASAIHGDGILRFTTPNNNWDPNKECPSTSFTLTGDNTDFHGKMKTSCWLYPSKGRTATINVGAAKNLGGAVLKDNVPTFRFNAVEVGVGGRLNATASFALNEPTRGLYLSEGLLKVENAADTLTLDTQVTVRGACVKEGPGAIAFNGTCRFGGDQATENVDATNVLTVAEGAIRPAAKLGADGLVFAFGATGGLLLDLPAVAGDDARAYGLYDVAATAPFDLTESAGRLNVSVAGLETSEAQSLEIAVCTVKDAVAADLVNKLAFARTSGFSLTGAVCRSNGDGSSTVVATIARKALSIILR